MSLYLDSAYIAKCYLNEPDAERVRALVRDQSGLASSAWCLESKLSKLRKRDLFLRAGDAVHLVTAAEAGFREVWTNDRHMLSAARSFGLKGRSV